VVIVVVVAALTVVLV